MYGWLMLATVGFLFACSFLIIQGLKFESDYSLFYLGSGLIFTPFFLYITLWSLPGLKPGKVLFTIVKGENGTIKSKVASIEIKNIQNVDLVRNPLNLINDIVIETFDNETIKIRTYNLLDDLEYQLVVDQYLYPYFMENAKKAWDRKVNLDKLQRVVKYERKTERMD